MEENYLSNLNDKIEASSLLSDEKEDILQLIKKIEKSFQVTTFKFTRTLKEKAAIHSLLSQISIDLSSQIEKTEEKSQTLEKQNRELEKTQKIAEEANKTKSRFLANMSHELRTPINGVLGMIQLIELTELTEEQSRYLEVLKTGGESLLSIINEVLDFSKIEAGKIDLEDHPFHLSSNITNTLELQKPNADKKGISISHSIDPQIPDTLNGDLMRIRQILLNLVGNAIKFTAKGSVHLSIKKIQEPKKDPFIQFTVKDTGIGISQEQIKKLFQPFTQADASITRKYGGTGLGLAISIKLIKLMGGEMWVESKIGVGSEFHFTLPLRIADPLQNTTQAVLADIPIKEIIKLDTSAKFPLKILLAEDNLVNQKVAKSSFGKMGYEIKIVDDGVQAVEQVKKEDFDIIFLDLHMPNMGGLETCQHIRELYGPTKEGPTIIAMTANIFQEVQTECWEAGMDDFLGKPYKLLALQEILVRWGEKKTQVEKIL